MSKSSKPWHEGLTSTERRLREIHGLIDMGCTMINARDVKWLLRKYFNSEKNLHSANLRIAELDRHVYTRLAADGR